jgi:glycosyltransferase involved in cell wall biosynthesis
MRILYATHAYKPAYRIGGPVLSVSAVAERLARRGHRVTVFTTNSNVDEDLDVPLDQPVPVEGVEVWYFRRQTPSARMAEALPYLFRSLGFLYAPKMRAALEEMVSGVDLVHTHLPFIYPTYSAARAAFRHRRPLFYHQRGVFDPNRLRFRNLKKRVYIAAVERRILQRATTLFALTSAEIESYRALGVQTPCRVIPNGIDVASYRVTPGRSIEKWRIPDGASVILFLGRLHPTKGADKLMEAFLRIASQFPAAFLVLAGPDEWKLEERYRLQSAQSGFAARVLFPGMVAGETKLDLLARADLFCLPSDAEGFSMAVLEALASATPVMISPGCHFPEVEAAGAGRIVEADAESMAAALRDLLAEPARLKEMGSRGRDLVSRYDWNRITDEIEDAYREGISRFRGSA